METTDGHRWTRILLEKILNPTGDLLSLRNSFLSVFICVHLWFQLFLEVQAMQGSHFVMLLPGDDGPQFRQ